MSHIDPRADHARSKALDVARASVSGGRARPRLYRSTKQTMTQLRRRRLDRGLTTLKGVRCLGGMECDCAACEFCDHPTEAIASVENGLGGWFAYWPTDHLSPGYRMARKKLVEFDGEFDPWFSWLKSHLPDTVAGRHLLDHIVTEIWCYRCLHSAKQNFRGCTCGRNALSPL